MQAVDVIGYGPGAQLKQDGYILLQDDQDLVKPAAPMKFHTCIML